MGERVNGIHEVEGSTPLPSTSLRLKRSGKRRLPAGAAVLGAQEDTDSIPKLRLASQLQDLFSFLRL